MVTPLRAMRQHRSQYSSHSNYKIGFNLRISFLFPLMSKGHLNRFHDKRSTIKLSQKDISDIQDTILRSYIVSFLLLVLF